MMLFSRCIRRLSRLPNPRTIRYLPHFYHSFSSHAIKQDLAMETNRIPISDAAKSRLKPTVSNIYNCNVNISALGRQGEVKEARKLFDEMPYRDIVSYASMITVYVKNNNLMEAEMLFRVMPERNIVAESVMVDGYVKSGQMDEARKVFDDMPERNAYSWTSLISGYFRIGQIDEGRRLFNQMPEKNVVSWTTLVLGYARNGLIDQACNIFDLMPEKNVVSWTTMIKSYIENDQFDKAHKLFYEMPQRNLYSWNIMIAGCMNANRVDEAIQLFNSMPQRNAVTWTTMVTGLARHGIANRAREYFDQMPNKDIAAWNAMITAYVDEGLMVEATKLFRMMPERNTVTWNAIIDGYARKGPEGEALKHLILILRSWFRPNETTITSILTSCEGMLELMQVHALVIPLGFEHDTSLTNALITVYSRSGDVRSARIAFENLETKDVVSWTAMILAYSYHGHGHHALCVFASMLRSGTMPDEITFVGILSACSHVGLIDKGQRLFKSMSLACDVEPKAEHYSCLVDILGRAGRLEEAMRVVCNMPERERDEAVLGALLSASRLHGDVRLANHISEKLIELEPSSSGGYVLLANAYAAGGKWDEFALVRKKMKEMKVKKVPGFSQIEVKGNNHVFFVGDKSHPQVEEIYELLKEKLLPLMKEVGYTHQNSSVLV